MRLVVGMTILMGLGGLSQAVATEPTSPASTSSPTEQSQATTEAAKPTADDIDKRLLAQGYGVEMRNGEKYYCRKEATLGSRLNEKKICATPDQLMTIRTQSTDHLREVQNLKPLTSN